MRTSDSSLSICDAIKQSGGWTVIRNLHFLGILWLENREWAGGWGGAGAAAVNVGRPLQFNRREIMVAGIRR